MCASDVFKSRRIRFPLSLFRAVLLGLVLPTGALGYDPLNGDFSRADPLDIRIVAYNHNRNFIEDPGTDAAFDRILTTLDPDIISFEEFTSAVSQADVANRMNAIIPIGGSGWQVHFGMLGGIRTVLVSRFPLTMKRIDTIPASSTRGVTIALADLPDVDYPVDVYLLAVHLKCCGSPGGSEDQKRQDSADAIANWLGDARGVARPSGDNVVLPTDTPMIALGDFNLVGGPQPETTILTGNIQDEATYGPDVAGDWDASSLTNLMPADPFTGNTFTWQGNGSFPPSALDRFFYTDSVITVANSFVLNTDTMTPTALAAAGLQAGDTLPQNTSDHLPIVMDLSIASGCTVDTDGDGTPDCNDGCPNDPNKIAPGICGCGTPDTDTDGDGTPDCNDGCPNDPNKLAPGICGCGTPDTDTDGDGTPDCLDLCPTDPNKTAPGQCGCGVPETAPDGDMNGDTLTDGLDIQLFADALVGGAPTQSDLCHGDFDGLNGLDAGDIPGMVNALLAGP
ncbi:MAG: endonuclease/exonuclease/phosphatase family protein [Phycisphaerae bacterium]